MTDHGFTGFDRGREGSTAEHLTTLQYQINKDKQRLAEIEKRILKAKIAYEPAKDIHKTYHDIETAGKKNHLTGNYSVIKEDYNQLIALAKEGITNRVKILVTDQILSAVLKRKGRSTALKKKFNYSVF